MHRMYFTKSDEGDEQIVLSFRQLWGLVREFIKYLTFHNQVNIKIVLLFVMIYFIVGLWREIW